LTKTAELWAPKSFWAAKPFVRDSVCNGCGTKGLGGLLVPDTLYGLSVTAACNIHDWMYHHGQVIADKEEADRAFLNNMIRIIEAHTKYGFIKFLRRRRAYKYYLSVKLFGGPAFWANKNRADELADVNLDWDVDWDIV